MNPQRLSHSPDKELIIYLQNDDKEAFSGVFWKYHAAIYKNVLTLIKDSSAAEDIVQEVFISLWEQRRKLILEKEIKGWLFVVSYNKSIDYLKQKRKEFLVSMEAIPAATFTPGGDTELLDVQLNLLEKAISQLSPQKRKVFEMCKLKRKTYQETAAELQLSRHTVKEHLSEAMVSIRKFIDQYPESTFMLFILLQAANVAE